MWLPASSNGIFAEKIGNPQIQLFICKLPFRGKVYPFDFWANSPYASSQSEKTQKGQFTCSKILTWNPKKMELLLLRKPCSNHWMPLFLRDHKLTTWETHQSPAGECISYQNCKTYQVLTSRCPMGTTCK